MVKTGVFLFLLALVSAASAEPRGPGLIRAAADYPWRVDESCRFAATEFNTAVGFHNLWDHILTYYPNKCGCEIYDAWNFHDILLEVVMETTPEMEGGEGKAVIAYRAFWDGADVVCTWTFYDYLGSEELHSDSVAFDANRVGQNYLSYSN